MLLPTVDLVAIMFTLTGLAVGYMLHKHLTKNLSAPKKSDPTPDKKNNLKKVGLIYQDLCDYLQQ